MQTFYKICLLLLIVGGVNWGLVGLFQFDLVGWLLGGSTSVWSRIVFALVGLAALGCIPELFRTLYLEYRNFSTDGSKYDKSEKQLTNSETSNIKSGLVCYLAQPDIRFPSNLNGKPGNWALEVKGGTQSTKSDAALGLSDSLQVTDKLKVTVAAIEGEVLTFQIEGEMEQHVHSGGQAKCGTNMRSIGMWEGIRRNRSNMPFESPATGL